MNSINLVKTIAQGVHFPNVDEYPLYVRVEDYQSDISNKSAKWVKMAQEHYNSPTNVRYVCITNKTITVELYKGIYEKGTLAKRKNIKSIRDRNLEEYAKCLIATEPMCKLEYKATGNPIRTLIHPWVCTNIERIFVDWTCLLDATEIIGYDKVIAVLTGRMQLSQDDLMAIVCDGLKCNPNEINYKFPRLHLIAYCFNLSEYVEQSKDISDLTRALSGNATIIKLKQAKTSKFSLRMGIYKYDDLVLSKYIDSITANKNEQASKQEPKEKQEPQEKQLSEERQEPEESKKDTGRPKESCIEEKLLLSIYNKTGADGLKRALLMCNTDTLLEQLTESTYNLCKKVLSQQ